MKYPDLEGKTAILACAALFILYIVLSYINAMSKPISTDDYAWLYAGWRLHEGDMLYKEVFDFHTPITDYIASFAFAFADEPRGAVFAYKNITWLLSLALTATVFLIGRRMYGNARGGAIAALVYAYGSQIVIFRNVFEILNAPTALFIALGIYFAIRWLKGGMKARELFLCGILLSLALLSNQRAVAAVCSASLALVLLAYFEIRKKEKEELKKKIAACALQTAPFFAGLALPATAFALWLIATGSLWNFFDLIARLSSDMNSLAPAGMALVHAEAFFVNSLNAPYLWPVGIFVMTAVGLANLGDAWKRKECSSPWLFLFLFAVFFAAITVLMIRFKATHVYFSLFPMLAVFAAKPLVEFLAEGFGALTSQKTALAAYVIVLLLLFPVARSFQFNTQFSGEYGTDKLEKQLAFTEYLNGMTNESEYVFDSGLAIMRKSAYFYHYDAYGGTGEGLVKALQEKNVRVIATHSQALPGQAEEYLAANYTLLKECNDGEFKAYARKDAFEDIGSLAVDISC